MEWQEKKSNIPNCEDATLSNIKSIMAFAHDSVVAALSVSLALFLRLGPEFFDLEVVTVLIMTVTFLTIAVVVFLSFGLYRGLWYYASLTDLLQIVKAVTTAVLIFLAIMHMLHFVYDGAVPRSMLVIQWFILIVFLGGSRFAFRLWKGRRFMSDETRAKAVPVLLVGVGDRAAQFIRATSDRLDDQYVVVGILDDTDRYEGLHMYGVPVLGKVADLPRIATRLASQGKRPQRLVITDPRSAIDLQAKQRLLEQAEQLGLSVARLPRLGELRAANDDGKLELNPIALEDLLGRPQAALNCDAIRQLIGGRRVLVTGAGGTIGSELCRQIAALGPSQLTMVDFSEFNLYNIDIELKELRTDVECRPVVCNIRERQRVMAVFAERRPELVFHAAALKHVPMVELNPREGILTNVIGTRNIADAAREHGALAMVQVSTDKAVNPTSMMGASKRLAEFYCQSVDVAANCAEGKAVDGETALPACARFMTVRFGNVLGSSGSVVPLFQRQLTRGGPLTVTHPEMTRFFMTVREAVQLVLQASAHGLADPSERGQIFVLDMGEPIKIVDIARQMIRLCGLRPDNDIKIKFTGLRPGEKLFEEIFDSSERRLPAVVDGVQVAASQPIGHGQLSCVIDALEAACERHDVDAIRSLMAEVLPSYEGGPAQPDESRPMVAPVSSTARRIQDAASTKREGPRLVASS